jgi:crotonobetainyl-CoA:carnitine CoA-transferase CaiB-like acyl-CoA transferase
MQETLAAVLRTRDAVEWEALLSAAGIPCGVVRDIAAAMSLPALDERSLRVPLHIPGLPQSEDVAVLGPGFVSAVSGPPHLHRPPQHGEHTAEILEWLNRP